MIVIATHAVFLNQKDIYGPPHAVSLYLNKRKSDHIFIKHSLDSSGYTVIEYFKDGKLKKKEVKKLFRFPFFLQYFVEMIVTLRIGFSKPNIDVFIGVDPLNAFAGYILKVFRRAKKLAYFSADFASQRFDNKALNFIYLQLDKFAMRIADQTWSISKRITAYRRKHGLSSKKNLLLPNAPFFQEIKRKSINKVDRYSLVIVARLAEGIAFRLLIEAFAEVKQEFPKAKLIMIGGGPLENDLRALAKKKNLSKSVIFSGPKSHDEMFDILTVSGIGIALYENSDPRHFHYFSDSMKVRDYLASGLPVIVSGNSAIIDEVEEYEVGRSVNLDKKDLVRKIKSLLKNKERYMKMRENALGLAEKYDTEKLIHNYLLKIKQ